MNEDDMPYPVSDPDGDIDEQEQYDEGSDTDGELEGDTKVPDGFHIE